MAVTDIILAKV